MNHGRTTRIILTLKQEGTKKKSKHFGRPKRSLPPPHSLSEFYLLKNGHVGVTPELFLRARERGVLCPVMFTGKRMSKWWTLPPQNRAPNREKPRQISQELKSRELPSCGFMSCSSRSAAPQNFLRLLRSAHNKIVVSSILLRPKRRAAQICAPLPPQKFLHCTKLCSGKSLLKSEEVPIYSDHVPFSDLQRI